MTDRCEDGRLMRAAPQRDDPYLEVDAGECPDCAGKGCSSHGAEPAKGADAPLLPCPFCGGPSKRLRPFADDREMAGCKTCEVWTMAETWNRRASPAEGEVTTGEADLLLEINIAMGVLHREWQADLRRTLTRCRASIESLARERDAANDTITKMHPAYTRDELDKANAENASLRAKLDETMDALEWYEDEAAAIARNLHSKPPKVDAVMASATVLALDGGSRARIARQSAQAASQPSNPET